MGAPPVIDCRVGHREMASMVGIAQLAERLVVVQEVAGSSPVTHPKKNPESKTRDFHILGLLIGHLN